MQTAKGISDKGIPGTKLADGAVTSAKIADGGVGTDDLAAKAVTRAKLADEVFPLFAMAEVSKQYTVGAGSTVNVMVGEIPSKPGYTYAGACAFNTGNLSCLTSGMSGRYLCIKNTYSQAITATASITFLYIRS